MPRSKMTEQRAKDVIRAIILEAFDFLPEEKRSQAFAEMVPEISTVLFTGKRPEKRDTQRMRIVPRDDP